jgi:hypothetical protein
MNEPSLASRDAGGRTLAERVVDAVPVTQLAFLKLLSLLDVQASREVPTACVTLGARSRLLINPDFVRERCATDEALVILVLHELFHVLLGHTRMLHVATPLQNWAFDAVINAHLCNLLPGPAHTALFRGLYRPDLFPEALLRPPEGWRTPQVRWALRGAPGEVHRALYTESSATYEELFHLMERTLGLEPFHGLERLLGSHGEGTGEGSNPDPELLGAVREIVARWPMLERRGGRDEGGVPEEGRIPVAEARKEAVRVIRRALLPLLDLGRGSSGAPRLAREPVLGVLPYRTLPDRRAEVRSALGTSPLLFLAQMDMPATRRFERVHVYVDVSGSMDAVIPLVYGALLPLMEYLEPRIHLFSTQVEDIRPRDLRAGVVKTTCGTAIHCVAAHILRRKVRRAVLVTDGWVGQVPSQHLKALRRRRVRTNVVLTAGGDPSFAAALGARVFTLPPLP